MASGSAGPSAAQSPIPGDNAAAETKTEIPLLDYINYLMLFLEVLLTSGHNQQHATVFLESVGIEKLIDIYYLPNLPQNFLMSTASQSLHAAFRALAQAAGGCSSLVAGKVQELFDTDELAVFLHGELPAVSTLEDLHPDPNMFRTVCVVTSLIDLLSSGSKTNLQTQELLLDASETSVSFRQNLGLLNVALLRRISSISRTLSAPRATDLDANLVFKTDQLLELLTVMDNVLAQLFAEQIAMALRMPKDDKHVTETLAETLKFTLHLVVGLDDSLLGQNLHSAIARMDLLALVLAQLRFFLFEAPRGKFEPNTKVVNTYLLAAFEEKKGLECFAKALAWLANEMDREDTDAKPGDDGRPVHLGGHFGEEPGAIVVSVHPSPLSLMDANIVHAIAGGSWLCDGCKGNSEGRLVRHSSTEDFDLCADCFFKARASQNQLTYAYAMNTCLDFAAKLVHPKLVRESPFTKNFQAMFGKPFDCDAFAQRTKEAVAASVQPLWDHPQLVRCDQTTVASVLTIVNHIITRDPEVPKPPETPQAAAAAASTVAVASRGAPPRPPFAADPVCVQLMQDMGFAEPDVLLALEVTNNGLQAATELILTGSLAAAAATAGISAAPRGSNEPQTEAEGASEEDDLARAIAMSMSGPSAAEQSTPMDERPAGEEGQAMAALPPPAAVDSATAAAVDSATAAAAVDSATAAAAVDSAAAAAAVDSATAAAAVDSATAAAAVEEAAEGPGIRLDSSINTVETDRALDLPENNKFQYLTKNLVAKCLKVQCMLSRIACPCPFCM